MIEFKKGDILREDAEAIVNTVNCVGVMGRGIALQFKKAFPDNFKAYAAACKRDEVQPGRMFVYDTGEVVNPRFIINFPTKRHWRGASRMSDIESGLDALVKEIRERGIRHIAIPPLGSGLGGLDWLEVKQLIEQKLAELDDVQIIVFEPGEAPDAEKMVRNKKVPKMTPGRAVLVELMRRYLAGCLDTSVSLLEIHKLMYFMQEAGEPLKLKYEKGTYGPYAENLGHVLNAVEGHLVSGYADGGDRPDKEIKLVPGAIEDASNFLQEHSESLARFERVSKLVDGYESPFGLELLSTVHWISRNETVYSPRDVIHRIYSWNDHKKQFTQNQIEKAIVILIDKGWIEGELKEYEISFRQITSPESKRAAEALFRATPDELRRTYKPGGTETK